MVDPPANLRPVRRRRRLPARFWRLLLLTFLLVSLSTEGLTAESTFQLELGALTAHRRFDWVAWEGGALVEEAGRWLQSRLSPIDLVTAAADHDQSQTLVLTYLARQQQIFALEDQIKANYARLRAGRQSPANAPGLAEMEQALTTLQQVQTSQAAQVEQILAAQVAAVLADEGLGQEGEVWPPVTFRFNNLPTYLIISPRNEIRQLPSVYLLPDMPEGERIALEARIEAQLDVSALVTDVGGIGSWPTLVAGPFSLDYTVDTVAHEWSHTYLALHPLGMHYSDSQDLTAMNETVASIVGEEIARLVIERFYPAEAPSIVPDQPTPSVPPPSVETEAEDFNGAMRRIRLHIDDLLAQGQIEAAENYMDEERLKLVAKGHNLRRLNQAYFAFHGSYATGPAAVDPIGPWLRALRAQSPSIKDFIEQVAQMDSRSDLLSALGLSEP